MPEQPQEFAQEQALFAKVKETTQHGNAITQKLIDDSQARIQEAIALRKIRMTGNNARPEIDVGLKLDADLAEASKKGVSVQTLLLVQMHRDYLKLSDEFAKFADKMTLMLSALNKEASHG